jgi:excisionase family DNA binding protein
VVAALPLINAAKVAALLGISPRAVYDLTYSGRLACYRIGGAVRFDPADVEAFKQSCRCEVRPAKVSKAVPVRLSLCSPDDDLARYFERHGVKRREKPQGNG